jgi:hypothetical protein
MGIIKIKRIELFDMSSSGINVYGKNSNVLKFISMQVKEVDNIYTLQIKLQKSFLKAFQEASELRVKLLESSSYKKKVLLKNGEEIETYIKIVDVEDALKHLENQLPLCLDKNILTQMNLNIDKYKKIIEDSKDADKSLLVDKINDIKIEGKKIVGVDYDIMDMKEWNTKFFEFLDGEIELNCTHIKLSKLQLEKEISGELLPIISSLDSFIFDDTE